MTTTQRYYLLHIRRDYWQVIDSNDNLPIYTEDDSPLVIQSWERAQDFVDKLNNGEPFNNPWR